MVKKGYSHLVKPLHAREAPSGLYPQPRIWMEGKDLEGFQANLSYGSSKSHAFVTRRKAQWCTLTTSVWSLRERTPRTYATSAQKYR